MSDAVVHEAKRCVLNGVAAALGGVDSDPVRILVGWARDNAAPGAGQVWGHPDRLAPAAAAMINGTMIHVLDFDDTHPGTLIHVTAPVLPAALHVAETLGLRGAAVLETFAIGAEVALRAGAAVFPSHYERGYHVSATAGAIGAAAAAGRALGLGAEAMGHALGIAAAIAGGLREMFGSHGKPFQVGHAAGNGVIAADLARRGLTATPTALEGRAGWARAVADAVDAGKLDGLGDAWTLLENTYKPWACGLVTHPAVDGIIRLREQHALSPATVESIDLLVSPRTLELCGERAPRLGLQGKFSVYHAAAVAVVDGRADEAQFTDARVQDPVVRAVRDKVTARADGALGIDQAHVTVRLTDGRRLEWRVEHSLGSPGNPMTDGMLVEKLRAASEGRLTPATCDEVIATIWALDRADDARVLGRLLRPAGAPRRTAAARGV